MVGSYIDQICFFIHGFSSDVMQSQQIITYFHRQGKKTVEIMDIQDG